MSSGLPRGQSRARLLVFGAIAGAILFGAFLAYLAWSNDSFPVQQKPFGDYATVVSSTFNGTEYSFEVRWLSADYLPLFAQLTSPASDAANSPVCGTGLSSVTAGQIIYMPFKITPAQVALISVELSIAVKPLPSGTDFTIVHSVASVSAQPGNVTPSDISCEQPRGLE